MSEYLEEAKRLRAIESPHYNCCQSVTLSFAEAAGMDPDTLYKLFANYGSGLSRGSGTCGAIAGGLAVLGLFGANDPATVKEYYSRLKAAHENALTCVELLTIDAKKGNKNKKAHCDGMVFECTSLAEEMLRERGLLK